MQVFPSAAKAPASSAVDTVHNSSSASAEIKSGRPPPPASPPPALPTSVGAATASAASSSSSSTLGSARQHAWWMGTVRTTHTLYWFFRVRQLLAANFARASEAHASDANSSHAVVNQMASANSVRSASIVALMTERTSAFRVPHLPVGASDGSASMLLPNAHSAMPPLFEASDRFCDPTREAVALFDSITRTLLRRFSDASERLPAATSLTVCAEQDLAGLFGANVLGLGDARNQSALFPTVAPFVSSLSASADATMAALTDIVPEECWLWLLAWLACFEQHVTDVGSPNSDALGGDAKKDAKQKEKQKKSKKDKKDEPPPKPVAGFYSLYTLLQPLLRLPSIDHARQALVHAHAHAPLMPLPTSAQHHTMLFSLIEHSNVLQRRLALLAVPMQRFVTDALSSAAASTSAFSAPPAPIDVNAPAALVAMLSRLGLTDVPKAAALVNASASVAANTGSSSGSPSSSPSLASTSTPTPFALPAANASGCFFSAADLLGSLQWPIPIQHAAHAARRRMRTGLHAPDRLPFALPLHMQTQAVCPSCQHHLSGMCNEERTRNENFQENLVFSYFRARFFENICLPCRFKCAHFLIPCFGFLWRLCRRGHFRGLV